MDTIKITPRDAKYMADAMLITFPDLKDGYRAVALVQPVVKL